MSAVVSRIAIRSCSGREAETLLQDEDGCRQWDALFAACPWATAFQSREFAETWYSVYRAKFDPLVILGSDEAGRLVGVFPLAVRRGSQEIVHVGAHQAEYQCWISQPELGEHFIEAALEHLRGRFPAGHLALIYLPPKSPLAWLTPGRRWAGRTFARSVKRPLMRVGPAGSVEASLRKKSNRSRISRLEQIGPLVLDVIQTRAELEPWFDRIIEDCDLRQAANHGVAPFAQDELKREFYLRLLDVPNLMHASVLWAGDTMLAAHIGARSGTYVQLGLIVHSPLHSKHSPGKLLLLLLGRELGRAGFMALDLTPSGEYKERFADDSDEVHAIEIFLSAKQASFSRARRAVVSIAKKFLAAAKLRDYRVAE